MQPSPQPEQRKEFKFNDEGIAVISHATQQILKLAQECNTSVIELNSRYQRDFAEIHHATLRKMETIVAEEPELFTADEASDDGAA